MARKSKSLFDKIYKYYWKSPKGFLFLLILFKYIVIIYII
jgi:hypothetical protein